MRKKWYLQGVPKKVNKEWTTEERKVIYSLYNQGLNRKDISKKLKIKVCKIDNQLRIMKKVLSNKCYVCGEKLTLSDKIKTRPHQTLFKCATCTEEINDYKKNLREKYLKEGICGICHKRKIIPGKKACKRCISLSHRRRYLEGICGVCGKRPISKGHIATCSICSTNMSLYNWKKRNEKQLA